MGDKSTMKQRVIIGIDPDIQMSGVARIDVDIRKAWTENLPFPLLIDYLRGVQSECIRTGKELTVYVEATWHMSHNWNLTRYDNVRTASRKGHDVGQMQQVGKLIIEMCEHHGISVHEQKPLQKMWKGKDGKITHEELSFITGSAWVKKRSNQEQRDALLIAWVQTNFPLRIKLDNLINV